MFPKLATKMDDPAIPTDYIRSEKNGDSDFFEIRRRRITIDVRRPSYRRAFNHITSYFLGNISASHRLTSDSPGDTYR